MAEIPIEIQQALNDLANEKAQQILAKAKAIVGKPNISASKKLLNSLAVSVKPATATEAPVITLTYADEGRFLDYKNPVWNKLADLKKLEAWVASRGVSAFRYVSGVNRTGMSEEQKIKKIASGVAWSQRLHQVKWKAKGWKKKTLVKLLQELNVKTAEVWRDGIVLKVEQELEK